ncbi:hypothetical protein C8Q72DRAFT_493684 [Fomitopsis betulina]|nr:hypothetical protein C8Q72DRAFT_493684 [Fomitopsis betulina]
MPKAQKPVRRKHPTQLMSSDDIPLPIFSRAAEDTHTEPITVRVLKRPRFGRERGTTWTVDEEPSSRLRRGALITMATPTQQSGTGKLSTVTDLRRHWVTFTISGATQPSHIRVPVAWASLDQLEGYTHARRYFDLPALPEPHESFRHLPGYNDETVNPYVADGKWGVNEAELEARVTKITKGSRRGDGVMYCEIGRC